ncbi:hypothetical protein OC844_005442 [Tilletia horrida]|nr:hypothetical protein OC844_005442 [Tilletia horrida]
MCHLGRPHFLTTRGSRPSPVHQKHHSYQSSYHTNLPTYATLDLLGRLDRLPNILAAVRQERGDLPEEVSHRLVRGQGGDGALRQVVVRHCRDASRTNAHAAELPYVFGNTTDFPSAGFYEPLSKTIQHIFISFANYHDPRRIGDLLWPQFTSSGRQALQLKGEATRVISETFREASLSYMKSDDAATVLSS